MENKTEPLFLKSPPKDSSIVFAIDGEWMMKIEKGKIRFNWEDFPHLSADEFAYQVLKIMEKSNVIQIDESQWDTGKIKKD